MPRTQLVRQLILIVTMAMLGACATTSPGSSSVIKTMRSIEGTDPFSNVLVISAAGDRSSRAQFEQEMSAAISNGETLATAFFAVVGRYPTISRTALSDAIRVREFDAILIVRRQGQERPELVPNRPTGRHFDLFHYDYEELNDLTSIRNAASLAFVVELYDTNSEEKIWSIDSLVFESESLAAGLSMQVEVIVGELRKDRLVNR